MRRTAQTAADGMPTFARRIDRTFDLTQAPAQRPAPALMPVVALASVSCAALLLFARPDGAESLAAGKRAAKPHGGVAAARKAAARPNVAAVAAPAGAGGRQSLAFYTSNVRQGMFSAPLPPAPAPRPAPPVTIKAPKPVIVPIKLPVINPFADWSYTGTVHMGDITMALLENSQTKEGQYVKPGDSFLGATVKSITDQSVTLASQGKPEMLAKADTIVVTPLNQNAPGMTPAQNGQQQAVAMQGQANMQAMPSGAAAATTPTFTLPNGRVLSGQRALRYQQRLNRGFGGGPGGGGFGGGRRGNNGNGG